MNQKVEWYELERREQYAPLLPASSIHTSSCPVAVEPSRSGYSDDFTFEVLFEGADTWEWKSPATTAIVQAYVTDLPNVRSHRLSNEDRTRTVCAAKIGLKTAIMNARLYDLPGFGAIDADYGGVIRNFIQQTDCIVYVAAAMKPLDENDLELLRSIHTHHRLTRKPVFFVLTQIDRAWNYDESSGKIQWETVRDANNGFLEQKFLTADGKIDSTFIGEGFIPVSPAFDAKGRALATQNPEDSQKYVADSGMEFLRQGFNDYLKNTSGPKHLVELALETQRLLSRLSQDIKQRYADESTPIRDAQRKIKGYKAQCGTIIEKKTKAVQDLENLGQVEITRAFASSDPDNLALYLSEHLSEKIKSTNVLQGKEIDSIDADKARLVQDWMNRNTKGLIPRWLSCWESFKGQSNALIDRLLTEALVAKQEAQGSDSDGEADITEAKVEERLITRYVDERAEAFKDTFDLMSKTWGAWTIVAGLGAAVSSVPQVIALLGVSSTPVGLGLLATALIGASYNHHKLSKQLNERREMMIAEFPEYAQKIVKEYRIQAEEIVNSRIGFLIEIIDNEIDSLSNSISLLEQRLGTDESLDRGRRLEKLADLIQECQEVDNKIKELCSSAENIQTNIATDDSAIATS
ncbi:MAG: hypothetical protein F6K30_26090 [Cyanothece sp. SIO2G6]|nr:hypothetical protein [Cyanothece sp. SIO2G6]